MHYVKTIQELLDIASAHQSRGGQAGRGSSRAGAEYGSGRIKLRLSVQRIEPDRCVQDPRSANKGCPCGRPFCFGRKLIGSTPSSRTMTFIDHLVGFEPMVPHHCMKRLFIVLLCSLPLFAQSQRGELRLRVTDPAGLGLKSSVELVSESNQFRQTFRTDDTGALDAQHLPFGVYRLEVKCEGFAPVSQSLEIRSAIPRELKLTLSVAGVNTSVERQRPGHAYRP